MANRLITVMRVVYFLSAMLAFDAHATDMDKLMQMSDQLDRTEQQDFGAAIGQANGCIKSRDFACAEAQLAKAAKFANDARDKNILASSNQSLATEKQQAATEARLRAEEAERVAVLERERREADERERRQQQGTEMAQTWREAAQILVQGIGNAAQAYNSTRQANTQSAYSNNNASANSASDACRAARCSGYAQECGNNSLSACQRAAACAYQCKLDSLPPGDPSAGALRDAIAKHNANAEELSHSNYVIDTNYRPPPGGGYQGYQGSKAIISDPTCTGMCAR